MPQLPRVGLIFRIEHAEQRAARERERDIERPRLSARRAARRNHDLERKTTAHAPQCRDRLRIVCFDDYLYVELGARVIQPLERSDEMRDDRFLSVEGHHDRIDR